MDNLVSQLFRTEFRKIVSVLTRTFGLSHIDIAEDIVADTFLLASETWGKKGYPDNPRAWLYTVAKNKTKDYLKRNSLLKKKIELDLKKEGISSELIEIEISNEIIKDSELRMMFAICHPSIPIESQTGLALRILFGFGIEEIADAFLTNKETINKRLHRAKEKLREEKIEFELPGEQEISQRISSVYLILYLLFNEGYYSTSQNTLIRKDICFQAMQLAYILTENEKTNTPELNALIALMCFHSSRFEARMRADEIILLEEQDNSKWDYHLIQTGEFYLNTSAKGKKISKYHLEAAIAYWHTQPNNLDSKWSTILNYYNLLLQLEYSPIIALNRTYAVYQTYGREKAIQEALKLNLNSHHQYHALLGTLYSNFDNTLAIEHLSKACELSKSENEKRLIQNKIDKLKQEPN
jgi:RNA polymerase sigma factor (sigma-70 family)